ncbi:MAG: hypothetical protein ACW99U_05365 [Candidatus Thorarchaeota archaeon]|jgi:hypothetical protein
MTCDDKVLWEILTEVTVDETGLAGVPIDYAVGRVMELTQERRLRCTTDQILALIERKLDTWEIDKTFDELSYEKLRELGLPAESGFIWHIKLLTEEKAEQYRTLRPEEQALIRLLRDQNEPNRVGEMPRSEAAEKLKALGFTEHLERIWVEDTVDTFGSFYKGEHVWFYGLVPEWKKTSEYKKWQEECSQRAMDKEMMRMRIVDESPITGPIGQWLEEESIPNTPEERFWKQVQTRVFTLPYEHLMRLQEVFNHKLPSKSQVIEFFNEMGIVLND